jgi:hypothetical protein
MENNTSRRAVLQGLVASAIVIATAKAVRA